MKYNLKLISLCLFFIVSGCQEKRGSHEDIDAKQLMVQVDPGQVSVVNISSSELKLSPGILKVDRMHVVDSLLVFYHLRPDSIVSIFGKNSGTLIASFGQRGGAPNEFNQTFPNTFEKVYANKPGFAVGNKMVNIQYYHIEDLIKGSDLPYKVVYPPPVLNGYRSIAYFSDTLVVGAPYGSDIHLFNFNVNENKAIKYADYPVSFPNIDADQRRELFGCYLSVKPDNKKFVTTYSNQGKLEIRDLISNQTIQTTYIGFPSLQENCKFDPNTGQISTSGNMIFSWAVTSTDRYIYAQIYNEEYNTVYPENGDGRAYIPKIHVFDWDGNLVTILQPDRYYWCFSVDENDEFLYSGDPDHENIFKYSLESLKH